jgi:hypothetical protein
MINIECTIVNSILDIFKKIGLQAIADKKEIKSVLDLIIINDLIEWAECIQDATIREA